MFFLHSLFFITKVMSFRLKVPNSNRFPYLILLMIEGPELEVNAFDTTIWATLVFHLYHSQAQIVIYLNELIYKPIFMCLVLLLNWELNHSLLLFVASTYYL